MEEKANQWLIRRGEEMEREKIKIIIESNFDNKDIVISLNYSDERTASEGLVQGHTFNVNSQFVENQHDISERIKKALVGTHNMF